MEERRPLSYAKTKGNVRQRQRYQRRRYQRQKLFLCIAILFLVVVAIRCLTRLYVIEDQVFGGEQEVRAADGITGGAEQLSKSLGQASGSGSAGQSENAGWLENAEQPENAEQSENSRAVSLSENEKQAWEAIYRENEELLILVNKEHSMSKEQEFSMRTICKGRLSVADCVYDDLCDMLADAKKENHEYWIASAYRSEERQQKLVEEDVRKYLTQGYNYDQALKKTYDYMMPAGFSEHQTGLSLDILCAGNLNMDDSQAQEPGNIWMKEHCHEYGFILRYPKEKESVTGIRYEPWHFRYVGKAAAAWLAERDLTLEDVLPLDDTEKI